MDDEAQTQVKTFTELLEKTQELADRNLQEAWRQQRRADALAALIESAHEAYRKEYRTDKRAKAACRILGFVNGNGRPSFPDAIFWEYLELVYGRIDYVITCSELPPTRVGLFFGPNHKSPPLPRGRQSMACQAGCSWNSG